MLRVYKGVLTVFRPVFKLLFRYRAEGLENIPQGSFIACANHTAYRDPVCVGCAVPRPMRFVAKADFKERLLPRTFMNLASVIYINRRQADIGSIRECVQSLKEGHSICIFPQGTRVREAPKPEQTMEGVSIICALSKAPVLPVALVYESYRPRLFTRCRVIIGKPVSYEEYSAAGSRSEQSRYIFGKVCRLFPSMEERRTKRDGAVNTAAKDINENDNN